MKKIYKILIYVGIFLILLILSFIMGRISRPKDFNMNKLEIIENELKHQQKRNEELLECLECYEKTIKELKLDNDGLNSKIQKIIFCSNDTENKLIVASSNITSSLDSIKILQLNNKILLEYFNNVGVITDEE